MKFYFVSKEDLDGQTIYPRVSLNKMSNEDNKIARISVSNSIIGCLSALGGLEKDEIYTVYICESENIYQPNLKEVLDSPLTGEVWVLEPVKLTKFTQLKIESVTYFHFGCIPLESFEFKYLT